MKKFTDELFKEAKGIFDKYVEHPFVDEMGKGTLDKEKFRDYLIQDYLYLKDYAKVFCIGVTKADTMDEMRFYYKSVEGTMEDETATHIKYLKDFGFTPKEVENMEINIINSSYTNFMLGTALTGDILDIALAVLPCTWSYNYIGVALRDKYKDTLENNFYKPWIDIYCDESYDEFTREWLDYVDEKCKDLSDDKKEKLKKIFIMSCMHEMNFWDMAYKIK
ncbi:MAG: thiaminase II [Clostridium sp.]|uniref:thiaminase II n=1 Tax=Clostridium TaxID=1485 RepID=UPI002152DD86|nr:thiaminase II [Clostridium sp. LY3-2]MCR6514165.1 thiaminase II [Clostridium sp. LY3-2]